MRNRIGFIGIFFKAGFVRMMLVAGALIAGGLLARSAGGDEPTPTGQTPYGQTPYAPDAFKQHLLDQLPAPISDGLDINLWGWVGYLHADHGSERNYYDMQLSLDITKSFAGKGAVTFEGNLIDANGDKRGEIEQAFVSLLVGDQTIVTIGKFNANFGIEPRDFWFRSTGTTSPLFGAQPQDLVGGMITQPIGDTGFKLRPFISIDFQGQCDWDQPPSAGLVVEYYTPNRDVHFEVTNWCGPGFVLFGGQPLRHPYPQGGYGGGVGDLISNWQGPNIYGERGSTLYFLNANVTWKPVAGLSLSAEYVLGTTHANTGTWGWDGVMGLVKYDLTRDWGLFARGTYLDDGDWLTTGTFQHVWEVSGGVSYHITDKLELRGEYRHDHSSAWGDVDSVSAHITAGF